MTMPIMRPQHLVGLVLLALIGAGCTPGAADEVQASKREAAAASQAVDELTQRVADLESRLTGAEGRFERELEDALGRLSRIREGLRTALGNVRETAESAAAGALARAEETLRQLTVLEDRFEYHLRRTSGG
ncbi:MAG: hypothetical protein ABR505_07010 [Actinomycetota bacterium]